MNMAQKGYLGLFLFAIGFPMWCVTPMTSTLVFVIATSALLGGVGLLLASALDYLNGTNP